VSAIEIVDYNPDWPIIFEREKKKVLEVIGEKIYSVEHIGSTSIPDLGAKPIIDMMADVEDFSVAKKCIPGLKKIGYTSFTRPHPWDPDHYFCCGKGPHSIGFHLHLMKLKCDEWDNHLLFRNYLRNHNEVAIQYCQLKKRLSKKHNRGDYTKEKSTFIEKIIQKAKED
jgi:GrpB-like predicted nucleotidyltransferase (UPF0157 family)